jgi:hypothetical protein
MMNVLVPMVAITSTAIGAQGQPRTIDVRVVTWGQNDKAEAARKCHILIRNVAPAMIEVSRFLECYTEGYRFGSKEPFTHHDCFGSEYPRDFVKVEPGGIHVFRVSLMELSSAAAHGAALNLDFTFSMHMAGDIRKCSVTYVIRTDVPDPQVDVSIDEDNKGPQGARGPSK